MGFKDDVLGTLAADGRSLRKFWNKDDVFGLEDGVYDLIFLPVALGFCVGGAVAWLRSRTDSTHKNPEPDAGADKTCSWCNSRVRKCPHCCTGTPMAFPEPPCTRETCGCTKGIRVRRRRKPDSRGKKA